MMHREMVAGLFSTTGDVIYGIQITGLRSGALTLPRRPCDPAPEIAPARVSPAARWLATCETVERGSARIRLVDYYNEHRVAHQHTYLFCRETHGGRLMLLTRYYTARNYASLIHPNYVFDRRCCSLRSVCATPLTSTISRSSEHVSDFLDLSRNSCDYLKR